MKEEIEAWKHWLNQFQAIETLGGAETRTISDLEIFEREIGFLLPKDYKAFCTVFGTCSFFQDRRVYCPSLSLSEQFLFPLRQEFNEAFKLNIFFECDNPSVYENIERFLAGEGLVFGDDSSAKIYLFDLESYREEDKSCDIWSASGEGELSDFLNIGRSFYDFFIDFCIESEEKPSFKTQKIISLPQEKKLLRKFNSDNFTNL